MLGAIDSGVRIIIEKAIGNLVDVSRLNFSDLFKEGISNLKLLDHQINLAVLSNQMFILDSGRISKIRCDLNTKEKRITLFIEKVHIDLLINEDVSCKEEIKETKQAKNSITWLEKIQKSIFDSLLTSYHLEMQIFDVTFGIKPSREYGLNASEWFTTEVDRIIIKKPIIIQKPNSIQSVKDVFINTLISGIRQKHIIRSMVVNPEVSYRDIPYSEKTRCFLMIDDKIESKIVLKINADTIGVLVDLKISPVKVVLYPKLIRSINH